MYRARHHHGLGDGGWNISPWPGLEYFGEPPESSDFTFLSVSSKLSGIYPFWDTPRIMIVISFCEFPKT